MSWRRICGWPWDSWAQSLRLAVSLSTTRTDAQHKPCNLVHIKTVLIDSHASEQSKTGDFAAELAEVFQRQVTQISVLFFGSGEVQRTVDHLLHCIPGGISELDGPVVEAESIAAISR